MRTKTTGKQAYKERTMPQQRIQNEYHANVVSMKSIIL